MLLNTLRPMYQLITLPCSQTHSEGPNYSLSIYRPEHKGLPAQIRLYHYPNLEDGQQVATKAFFNAESVDFKWEARGRAVLVRSSTAVRSHCHACVSVSCCPHDFYTYYCCCRLTKGRRGSSLARASTTAPLPCVCRDLVQAFVVALVFVNSNGQPCSGLSAEACRADLCCACTNVATTSPPTVPSSVLFP